MNLRQAKGQVPASDRRLISVGFGPLFRPSFSPPNLVSLMGPHLGTTPYQPPACCSRATGLIRYPQAGLLVRGCGPPWPSKLRRTPLYEIGAYDWTMPEQAPDPAWNGDERTTLTGFLEDQRSTLAWKCQGLSDAQLKEPSVPPSNLTLLGLVRHMAEVERAWFRRRLSEESVGRIWCTDAQPDSDFEGVADADVAEAFSSWEGECRIARSILKDLDSLEVTFNAPPVLEMSARCMVNHMIEEYSRHNGHADLIRERIDGKTGDFPSPVEGPVQLVRTGIASAPKLFGLVDGAAGIAERVKTAFEAADLSAFGDLLDPKVTWGPPGAPSPTCQTRDQVLAWYQRGRATGRRAQVSEVNVLGDRIVLGLRVSDGSTAQESGGAVERWLVLTVGGGLIVDIVGFDERELAMARAAEVPALERRERIE